LSPSGGCLEGSVVAPAAADDRGAGWRGRAHERVLVAVKEAVASSSPWHASYRRQSPRLQGFPLGPWDLRRHHCSPREHTTPFVTAGTESGAEDPAADRDDPKYIRSPASPAPLP